MIQQVNLYQDIIRQGQTANAVNPYVAALIASVLALTAVSGYSLWRLDQVKTEVEQARSSLSTEQGRVDELLAKFPKPEQDASLVAQIGQLQTRIGELTQTLHLLTDKTSSATQGFSAHFAALANQSIPEVWLNKIFISGQQRIVDLEGSSFHSEQIPAFLRRLQQEPVFHGQTFAKLAMLQSEKIAAQLDFKLNTVIEDPKQP